jgi:hypothetical protein
MIILNDRTLLFRIDDYMRFGGKNLLITKRLDTFPRILQIKKHRVKPHRPLISDTKNSMLGKENAGNSKTVSEGLPMGLLERETGIEPATSSLGKR